MGGIDPFGDIMGTSAGHEADENKYLFRVNARLQSSIGTSQAGGGDKHCHTHTEGQTTGSLTELCNTFVKMPHCIPVDQPVIFILKCTRLMHLASKCSQLSSSLCMYITSVQFM